MVKHRGRYQLYRSFLLLIGHAHGPMSLKQDVFFICVNQIMKTGHHVKGTSRLMLEWRQLSAHELFPKRLQTLGCYRVERTISCESVSVRQRLGNVSIDFVTAGT